MKGWTLLGIVLAVIGVVLFLNGLNNRMTTGIDLKTDSLPHDSPSMLSGSPADSSVVRKQPSGNTDGVEQSMKSIRESRQNAEKLDTPTVIDNENSHPETFAFQELGSSQTVIDKPSPSFVFENDPEDRKKTLIKLLREANWSAAEIEQLTEYLKDPRANFRGEILVRNSTFTENADQYSHNLTNDAVTRSEKFLLDNQDILSFVQKTEGVPREVLVAILKVETNLGEWRGKESVFNVYWSLALGDHPGVQRDLLTNDPTKSVEMRARMIKRAFWARGQLRDLLYVAKHGGENPVGILGSFAGAFGLPQFIPSSYRSFGQDGNGDGIVDLDAIPDAVRSIGYYLKENGWPNRPDRGRMRKSILSYNHSSFYADCVLTLADSLSMRLNGAPLAN